MYAAASKRFPALASGLIVELRLDSGRLQLSRVVQDSGMPSAGVQGQHHICLQFELGQYRVVQQLLVHKPGTSPRLHTDVAADQHLRILLPSMLRPRPPALWPSRCAAITSVRATAPWTGSGGSSRPSSSSA